MIEHNVNDHVRVKLTLRGREILEQDFQKMKRVSRGMVDWDYRPPKEDAEGWSEWQTWELMRAFGNHVYNGCEIPFETTILVEPLTATPEPGKLATS